MAYLRLTHSSSSLDLSSNVQPLLELTPLFPRPSPSVSAPSTPPTSRETRFVEDEEATPVNSGGHGEELEEVVERGWTGVSTLRRDVNAFQKSLDHFYILQEEIIRQTGLASYSALHHDVSSSLSAIISSALLLTKRIQRLAENEETRRSLALVGQVKALGGEMREVLRRWAGQEKEYGVSIRERAERQIKLLHPLIPPPDLSRALDTGVQGQIFAQEMLSSAVGLTSARGKGAFREVQERLEEMRSVNGRYEQLETMVTDMTILIDRQDDLVIDFNESSQVTPRDLEIGATHPTQNPPLSHQRKPRRWRWILWSFLLVLAFIILIVLVVLQVHFKVFTGGHR